MGGKLLIVLALLAAALACGRGPAYVRPVDGSTREVRDDLGRTTVVPQNIDRAISLAPSITEMVFAAGAGDRLVGVTTYCDYPTEAAKIEKIGDTQTPNIERIIALKPQIVLVSTASQLEAFSNTLAEQGIAVVVIDTAGLEDVLKDIRQLGELLGTTDSADEEIARLSARIRTIDERIRLNEHWGREIGIETPRVFLQISHDPLFTIGRDSFLTDLIKRAGGVSVTESVPTAYPKLSKEAAAALDPDVILLSDSKDNREPSAAFQTSKAVKNGHVYRINADIISRPGPRLVDALDEIVGMIQRVRI